MRADLLPERFLPVKILTLDSVLLAEYRQSRRHSGNNWDVFGPFGLGTLVAKDLNDLKETALEIRAIKILEIRAMDNFERLMTDPGPRRSSDVEPSPPSGEIDMMQKSKYSQTLRAIGQDLEVRGVAAFNLIHHGNDYFVQATRGGPSTDLPLSEDVGRSSDKTSHQPGARGVFPTSEIFQIHYSHDEIDRLDEKGREKRGIFSGTPDFLNLSQILRAVGATIDLRAGHLLTLVKPVQFGTMPSVNIRYQSRQGEFREEERSYPNIYDLCVHLYKQRHTWSTQPLRALASR